MIPDLKVAAFAAISVLATGVSCKMTAIEPPVGIPTPLPHIGIPSGCPIGTASASGIIATSLQGTGRYPTGNYSRPTGTGTSVGTGVTTIPSATIPGYDPIYTGPLPAWATKIIKEAEEIDAVASKLWEEAKGIFGHGTATSSADPSIGTIGVQARSPKLSSGGSGGGGSSHHHHPPPPPPVHHTVPEAKPTKKPEPESTKAHSVTEHSSSVHETSVSHSSSHTSSTKKHSSSTRTSTTRAASPTNGRPKCAGSCSGTSCSRPKRRDDEEIPAHQPRAAMGSSLQVMSLVRRGYTATVSAKTYVVGVIHEKYAKTTLLMDSVKRYPPLEDDVGDEVSTSQVLTFAEIDKDFNSGTGQLTGCTALMIVSDKAVFTTHYWENLAFQENPGEAPASLEIQVMDPLFNGKMLGEQRVQDSLYAAVEKGLFEGAEIYIMTPARNTIEPHVATFETQILLLEAALSKMLPESDIKRHLYLPPDDGWYAPDSFPHLKSTEKRVHEGKDQVLYPELVREQTDSDGYALFQYAVKQSGTKSGTRVFMETEKMRDVKFVPVPKSERGSPSS